MNNLTRPSADEFDDLAFAIAQMFTWASKVCNLSLEDHAAHHPEETRRALLAIKNGIATTELRLDPLAHTASYFIHLDGGKSLELFGIIPAPVLGADHA